MINEDSKHKASYFFDKDLKQIFKNNNKPLFGFVEGDYYNSNSTADLSERSGNKKDSTGSLNYTQENLSSDVCSWKESFFFSRNDQRLTGGVSFFHSIDDQGSVPFNEIRNKLKQCIRHKLSKRKKFVIKKKFNKRNRKRHVYKKI